MPRGLLRKRLRKESGPFWNPSGNPPALAPRHATHGNAATSLAALGSGGRGFSMPVFKPRSLSSHWSRLAVAQRSCGCRLAKAASPGRFFLAWPGRRPFRRRLPGAEKRAAVTLGALNGRARCQSPVRRAAIGWRDVWRVVPRCTRGSSSSSSRRSRSRCRGPVMGALPPRA